MVMWESPSESTIVSADYRRRENWWLNARHRTNLYYLFAASAWAWMPGSRHGLRYCPPQSGGEPHDPRMVLASLPRLPLCMRPKVTLVAMLSMACFKETDDISGLDRRVSGGCATPGDLLENSIRGVPRLRSTPNVATACCVTFCIGVSDSAAR
jgi:hypothetical protein